MKRQLKALWNLAFGDPERWVELFFSTAYAPDRCRYLAEDGKVVAMLFWLDAAFQGAQYAYLYAIATHADFRGQGLCRKLMDKTHGDLKDAGYAGALLLPANDALRQMYGKMGYKTNAFVDTFAAAVKADAPALPFREVEKEEYAQLRRKFLPQGGLVQEGANLDFLAGYCRLFAGEDFLAAAVVEDRKLTAPEFLGNALAGPALTAALGCQVGHFRCPGTREAFTMYRPLQEGAPIPGYLGLTFD